MSDEASDGAAERGLEEQEPSLDDLEDGCGCVEIRERSPRSANPRRKSRRVSPCVRPFDSMNDQVQNVARAHVR